MVEFALIIPILMFVFMGIMELALMFNAFVGVNRASQNGAHLASVLSNQPSADCFILTRLEGDVSPPMSPNHVKWVSIDYTSMAGNYPYLRQKWDRTGSTECTLPDGNTTTVPYTLAAGSDYPPDQRCSVLAGCPGLDPSALDGGQHRRQRQLRTLLGHAAQRPLWLLRRWRQQVDLHPAQHLPHGADTVKRLLRAQGPAQEPRRRERGQGLVEFALVLPILVLLVVSTGELGLIFGKMHSLGYASREGARVGAAMAQGVGCGPTEPNQDPSKVDATLIGAVQRILTSPDSGIRLADVPEVRIFKADATGGETAGTVSLWTPLAEGELGTEIDPGPGNGQDLVRAPGVELARLHAEEHRRHGQPEQRRIHRRDRQVPLRLRHPAPGAARRPLRRSAFTDPEPDHGHGPEPHLGDPVKTVRMLTTAGVHRLGRLSGRTPADDGRMRERGQVLAIFAVMSIVLLGGAALVTDVTNWWMFEQRLQRAADAAALAGAVYMPEFFDTKATPAAIAEAKRNGFDDALPNVVVTPRRDPSNPRKLIVDIDAPVQTNFARVFCWEGGPCLDKVDVGVTGAAEYVLPVPMGSPENYYGVFGTLRGATFTEMGRADQRHEHDPELRPAGGHDRARRHVDGQLRHPHRGRELEQQRLRPHDGERGGPSVGHPRDRDPDRRSHPRPGCQPGLHHHGHRGPPERRVRLGLLQQLADRGPALVGWRDHLDDAGCRRRRQPHDQHQRRLHPRLGVQPRGVAEDRPAMGSRRLPRHQLPRPTHGHQGLLDVHHSRSRSTTSRSG